MKTDAVAKTPGGVGGGRNEAHIYNILHVLVLTFNKLGEGHYFISFIGD